MCWKSEDETYNDGKAFKITCRTVDGRDGHDPRRQLLRLLQEGSEDADQLRRQSVRPGRGGARRRRAGVRQLQPRRPVPRRQPRRERAATRSPKPSRLLRRPRSTCMPRRIRRRQGLSRHHLRPRGRADRPADAEGELDEGRQRAVDQAAARQGLRPPHRLQGPAGKASRRTVVAAGRHAWPKGRSATSPARSPAAARARSPSRSPTRSSTARSTSPTWRRTSTGSRQIFNRDYSDRFLPALPARLLAPPQSRPLLSPAAVAGVGHQAADALAGRIHRRIQRLAGVDPQPHPLAGLLHQAVLQAGVGRQLAAAFQRRRRQRRAGPRAEIRQPQSSSAATCASASPTTAAGGCSSCGRISSPPTRCRWRTTSPRRRSCRPTCCRTCPIGYDNPSVKLVENCEYRLFQRPDDAIHRGYDKQTEGGHGRSRGCSPRNYEPSRRGRRRGRWSRTWSSSTSSRRRCRRTAEGRGREGRRLRRQLGQPAHRGRQAEQEPALSADAARRRPPARPVRGGDRRAAATAACPPTSRWSSR